MCIFRYRGCRGGTHKKHTVPTIITGHRLPTTFQKCGSSINTNNLTSIPLVSTPTHHTPLVRFASWNARSIRAKNKSSSLCDFVIGAQLDVVAITETWLTGDNRDDQVIADIQNTLPNYKFLHSHRRCGRGGGIAILVRDGLHIGVNDIHAFNSFEYMDVTISSSATSFHLVVLYRPPPNNKNKLTSSLFFNDFSSLLEILTVGSTQLLLTGDFNVHVDVVNDRDAVKILNLLDTYNLQQHVREPTHTCNHTLDLLISREDDDLVSCLNIQHGLPSDHFAIKCLLNICRPGPCTKQTSTRGLHNINIDDICTDIHSSLSLMPLAMDLDHLVSEYNNILAGALDSHAPLLHRTVILRPHAPWYSDTLRAAKRERRRLERKWLQTRLTVHKEIYLDQCDTYKTLLDKLKADYHTDLITQSDQRNLFRVINNLTSRKASRSLPAHAEDLANSFNEFFHTKVRKLRDSLDLVAKSSLSVVVTESCTTSFANFSEVSEDEVLRVIKLSTVTSCSLDPLPANILKLALDHLLPTIIRIVNNSLSSGVFPSALKHACVTPLLKKPGLDAEILANYRPISNLPFLGKVIERVVVNQLQHYLVENHLHAPMQSAYRPFHSTETALLRVQNDILSALDRRNEAILVLLDFSAAFDTIDHTQLIDRLVERYGITDKALDWFSTYLYGRTQSVVIDNTISHPTSLDCGVPQGSVIGPIAFILFSAPLQDIIAAHGIQSVAYADDTQLYLTFNPSDRDDAVNKMEACITDIKSWCRSNMLVLNEKKTEFIYFSSHFCNSSWNPTIKVGNSTIHPVSQARNLGMIMDTSLRMSSHVHNLCKAALHAIRMIGNIRQYLDQKTTTMLVHAFVTSRLDACNSLLFGLPDNLINKIQRVQNIAARLILRVPRHEHITPLLYRLHWLPIRQRIAFKILLLTYKVINCMAPDFISELVQLHVPSRVLRSASEQRLEITIRSSTKFYGDRSFASAAPHLWNGLPNSIRSALSVATFKSRLKTHLFTQHFLSV